MLKKQTIDDCKDDSGNALEVGILYSVYQTDDTPGGGILLYYAGDGEWIDADTDEPIDIPQDAFCRGYYEYACRQSGAPRPDLIGEHRAATI
jgi:hypothetical protein